MPPSKKSQRPTTPSKKSKRSTTPSKKPKRSTTPSKKPARAAPAKAAAVEPPLAPRFPPEFADAIADRFPPGVIRPSERHLEVLHAALTLLGERGYAGASLRELARRLGMSQPSLYHYFESKERLVEQIITHLGFELLAVWPDRAPPRRLAEVPRFIVEMLLAVYAKPAYPGFVRFLFAVSTEQPQYRAAIQSLYRGGLDLGARLLMAPFVAAGEIGDREAWSLLRTVTNSFGLVLIEEMVLYGRASPSPEALAYAEDMVRLIERSLGARR